MQVLAWNRAAEQLSMRRRVFWNSYSDFLEQYPPVADRRQQACELMESTPHLDHLILTKRPENWCLLPRHWKDEWPRHVWFGISAENQETLNERMGTALDVPAWIHWISAEPLLEALDFGPWFWEVGFHDLGDGDTVKKVQSTHWIDWVIVGGESGSQARPCHMDWVRSIRDQCQDAGIPFFLKQIGACGFDRNDSQGAPVRMHLRDRKGGDMNEFPEDLRIREFTQKGGESR